MDDYAALVERVCFVLPKVLGCLLLSEDGLVLSAYPEDGNVAEAAWRHFFAIQEPVRGFLAFADQNWVYVRHGAYAMFVVADVGVRPGVLVDQLEQVLTTSATGASETFRVPEAVAPAPVPTPTPAPAPTPPPREPDPAPPPVPAAVVKEVPEARPVADVEAISVAADADSKKGDSKKGDSKKGDSKKGEAAPPLAPPAASVARAGSWAQVGVADRSDDDDGEVDRVQLAQEFSGLLQMDGADDEASS